MSEIKKSNRGRKPTLSDSARKRNRKIVARNYNKARIGIGDQLSRWIELKEALQIDTHAEVARVLLDSYSSSDAKRPKLDVTSPANADPNPKCNQGPFVTSTPAPMTLYPKALTDISRISSSDQEQSHGDSGMSGIEEMGAVSKKKYIFPSSSFVDPFELTIASSEHVIDSDSDDADYEPSFDLSTLKPGIDQSLIEIEEEYETDNEEEPQDQSDVDLGSGVTLLRDTDHIENFVEEKTFLVYMVPLITLANTKINTVCTVKGCETPVSIQHEIISSAVYLKWICSNNHLIHKWCSQPVMNRRMHSGDLMLAACILFSGSNFQKFSQLAQFMNLSILSPATFHRIQRTYLIPSIDDHWVEMQDDIIQEFANERVVVLGDGRMDSPGHTAQYCTYSFMEITTKKILCIITMDKRVTDRKSTNLEKACFLKGMQLLQRKNINVVEVVTDAHTQISALMKKEFPGVKHSYDVWHGAKNLGKRIVKAGNKDKDNKVLVSWSKDVVNHFWHSAEQSNKSLETFLGIWFGIIHHVVDEHEWLLSYSASSVTEQSEISHFTNSTSQCSHGPLPEERNKPWIVKGSKPHAALKHIVMDKRFLNTIPYYLEFRSTSELETFQNLILKYSSKRNSYKPPAFRARNLLAAMDHNVNADRPVLYNKDGSIRYQRNFNKKSGRWSVCPVKTAKQYPHVRCLLKKLLKMRLEDNVGMCQPVVLSVDDPRRLSATLAPIPPPPTADIVKEQKSRFCHEDPDATIDYEYDA